MAGVAELDYILSDCFLAVGQAVGLERSLDLDTVIWWHQRYRRAFHHAITTQGASWTDDRHRVTAVGRHLGRRAVEQAGQAASIDRHTAARASHEVERGCQMNASYEGVLPAKRGTTSALSTSQ